MALHLNMTVYVLINAAQSLYTKKKNNDVFSPLVDFSGKVINIQIAR